MRIPKIEIIELSNSFHVNQLLTGLFSLEKMKKIKLIYSKSVPSNYYFKSSCLLEIDGIKCLFDLNDGYNFDLIEYDTLLDSIAFCFKRSYSKVLNASLRNDHKIREYGLNYEVNGKRTPLLETQKNLSKLFKVLLGIEKYRYREEFFTCKPTYKVTSHPKIIFSARLWDPEDNSIENEEVKKERYIINENRIRLIRELKSKYGKYFVGGLHDNSIARKLAPDLILSRFKTGRVAFMKQMKKSDICIGSAGLHSSIGWKTAEYVAASKAIVLERPIYSAPNFKENINYLGYDSVDECVEQIEKLIKNPNFILAMQKNNELYYQNYLRPDVLVLNCINQVLSQTNK